jgi:uncharacterized membrane protein HdeD (DUF308 family)
MLVIMHLIKSFLRAFFTITLTALVCGGLAAEAVLLVARLYGYSWPPTRLIEVVAIAIGALTAYAAGLTALLLTALRAALAVESGVVKGVEREIVHAGR